MELIHVFTFTKEADCPRVEEALCSRGIAYFISGKDNCANDGLPKRVMVDGVKAQEAKTLLEGLIK